MRLKRTLDRKTWMVILRFCIRLQSDLWGTLMLIKAGFLHDVVEDSSMTLEDLKSKGVEDEVIAALALLTHDKEKVGYFEYVENIIASGNVTAIHVKLNDLHHNLQRGKVSYEAAVASNDAAKIKELKRINAKHEKALEMIKNAGYEQ